MKVSDVMPIYKIEERTSLKNYLRETCIIRFSYTLIIFYPHIFLDIEQVTAQNNV